MMSAVRVYDILRTSNIVCCIIDPEDPVLIYFVSDKEKTILTRGGVFSGGIFKDTFLLKYIFKSRKQVFFELRKKILGKV